MSLLKRKANGEFEDWRVYTPVTNASSSPDSARPAKRKRKVKSDDTGPSIGAGNVGGRTGSSPTSSPTSQLPPPASARPTKRARKVKPEDYDGFIGTGDTRPCGTLARSRIPSMASGAGSQVANPATTASSSTIYDTKLGNPSTSTADQWFSDPIHGYSISAPSTFQAKAPPNAAATPDIKMTPNAAPIPQKSPSKANTPRQPKPKPEKRGAIFKKKCPQNILDRLDRVIEQRFFMIDRERDGDELKETFKVLGSTGNVYTVVIDHTPRCDCPDASKGNHCKHIIFVFIKVLQVPQESPHWYQKALLTSELQDVFSHAPNAVANERLRQAHLQATGKAPASDSNKTSSNRRMPTEEDDCPICYDKMHTEPENKLTWCEVCGNALHGVCFAQWRTTAQNSGKNVTCVWCRAEWVLPNAGKGKGKAIGDEGYVNLAAVAGVSTERDTSSYYHGARRGNRYGYQKYGMW
ncbi:uncharacterized protein EV420DRAFT_1524548 [Desarmillaria tabescens]|uniref:SWIM-type domain-containing protein n=1 Tax=Armillaria tabescens TaxID=1929756 RepID=A0AA39NB56_ARMTA|nr:uncharacterized protein EV420DRAFT_1524548 [Desarmillaria tabescens]KAK0462400.1 hypothetical protein EV420DRAFT_1524548 [Desarmillaria tabescens]